MERILAQMKTPRTGFELAQPTVLEPYNYMDLDDGAAVERQCKIAAAIEESWGLVSGIPSHGSPVEFLNAKLVRRKIDLLAETCRPAQGYEWRQIDETLWTRGHLATPLSDRPDLDVEITGLTFPEQILLLEQMSQKLQQPLVLPTLEQLYRIGHQKKDSGRATLPAHPVFTGEVVIANNYGDLEVRKVKGVEFLDHRTSSTGVRVRYATDHVQWGIETYPGALGPFEVVPLEGNVRETTKPSSAYWDGIVFGNDGLSALAGAQFHYRKRSSNELKDVFIGRGHDPVSDISKSYKVYLFTNENPRK